VKRLNNNNSNLVIITADVGNTQSVFGIWKNDQLINSVRISTSHERTSDEWSWMLHSWLSNGGGQGMYSINATVLCSVVPATETALEQAFRMVGSREVFHVHRDLKFPFFYDMIKNPNVGMDRLANAAGGVSFYGENLIILDFGTAITFCLLENKEYKGGVIAPGVHTSLQSLTSRTAKLPEIKYTYKEKILGNTTRDSMESGIYFGWKGLTREIVQQMKAEAMSPQNLKVIATGGISLELGFGHEFFDVVDPFLTLRGILEVYKLNSTYE
jgi:type III pantothenate kinase